MRATLRRVAASTQAMCGVLMVHDETGDLPLCVTLEDPWRNNRVGESCIPAGTYRFRLHESPKYGWTVLGVGIPGRSLILIHWGNTEIDTKGCILVGREFGRLVDKPAVLESRAAFEALRGAFMRKGLTEIDLTVEDRWGGSTTLSRAN